MAGTQIQYRRGSNTQNDAFTGALGEITVDTTADTLRVHDGSTAGGYTLVNLSASQTLTNKTLTSPTINEITKNGSDGSGNIGQSDNGYDTVHAKATSAQYADVAEIYVSDSQYESGTVVVFGGDNEVTVSTQSHDSAVAGVVSTNPAYLMNSTETGVAVALLGRVPCKVLGPVRKGQLLVQSEHEGVAQRLNDAHYTPGCVIGKALEDIENIETKTIEVVVGRL